MSIQVAILKVLSGHPGGRASVAAVNSDLGILNLSRDWTERMRRLAVRAPALSIFTEGYVSRDASGWQLTEAGRAILLALEDPAAAMPPRSQRQPAPVIRQPVVTSPTEVPALTIIGRKDRSRRRRRAAA